MATIYNSDLQKELQEGAKIQVRDKAPTEITDKVLPVMEVNPKFFRRVNWNFAGAGTNATSTSLGTTPTDREIYVTGATLSVTKDATATTTYVRLNCTADNGQSVILCSFGCITLTAEQHDMSVSFPFPIRLKKGTTITISASTAVGNFNAFASVFGYQVMNADA